MNYVSWTMAGIVALSIGTTWSHSQNRCHAGNESPLVKLGAQGVYKTINYPEWFQYPATAPEIRQQLVNDYNMREFLRGFDEADKTTPARVTSLIQTFLDFAGALVGTPQFVPYTAQEANRDLKGKVIPVLIKPREGYQLDSPSENEADYDGQNGDEIRMIDKEIWYLARHNNIPTGYRPPAAYMTPSARAAWQRNQDKVAQETLCWIPPAAAQPEDRATAACRQACSELPRGAFCGACKPMLSSPKPRN